MSAPAGDSASASVLVRVARETAFDRFTRELDLWWRHGKKYRIAGARPGRLSLQCRLGGELVETVQTRSGPRTFVVGRVLAWEPPERVYFEWRNVNFAPGEKTFVEVLFSVVSEGTMVRVRHHGWSALRDDHPARHGLVGAPWLRSVGLWWGGLLTALREHAGSER